MALVVQGHWSAWASGRGTDQARVVYAANTHATSYTAVAAPVGPSPPASPPYPMLPPSPSAPAVVESGATICENACLDFRTAVDNNGNPHAWSYMDGWSQYDPDQGYEGSYQYEFQQGVGGCPYAPATAPVPSANGMFRHGCWSQMTDFQLPGQDGGPDSDHTTSPFFANYWCDDGYAPEPGSIAAQRTAGTLPPDPMGDGRDRVSPGYFNNGRGFYIIPAVTNQIGTAHVQYVGNNVVAGAPTGLVLSVAEQSTYVTDWSNEPGAAAPTCTQTGPSRRRAHMDTIATTAARVWSRARRGADANWNKSRPNGFHTSRKALALKTPWLRVRR